jgi:hypothetical protein
MMLGNFRCQQVEVPLVTYYKVSCMFFIYRQISTEITSFNILYTNKAFQSNYTISGTYVVPINNNKTLSFLALYFIGCWYQFPNRWFSNQLSKEFRKKNLKTCQSVFYFNLFPAEANNLLVGNVIPSSQHAHNNQEKVKWFFFLKN